MTARGSWDGPWRGFAADYGIGFTTLDDAYAALVQFWQPVLAGAAGEEWYADAWTWT